MNTLLKGMCISVVCLTCVIFRGTTRDGKRSKRMMCSCQFDPGIIVPLSAHDCFFLETDNLSEACGENCLNRLLMIEW